jgi:hypothetical protein
MKTSNNNKRRRRRRRRHKQKKSTQFLHHPHTGKIKSYLIEKVVDNRIWIF